MRPPIRLALAALFCATVAAGEIPPFGKLFPATNTRYGPSWGNTPLVRSDGQAAFVFWQQQALYVTRVRAGERHLGREVFASVDSGVDAVWNGERFIVAASVRNPAGGLDVVVRTVGRDGIPADDAVVAMKNARWPKLGSNGTATLLVAQSTTSRFGEAVLLDPLGRPAGAAQRFTDLPASGFRVAANDRYFAVTYPAQTSVHMVMLDAAGRRVYEWQFYGYSEAPVAWNGTQFGVAVLGDRDTLTAFNLNADGTRIFGPPRLNVETGDAGSPLDLVWTGSTWVVASTRITEYDAAASRVIRRLTPPPGVSSMVSIAGVLTAAWSDGTTVHTSPIPAKAGEIEDVGYAALSQWIDAAASSADATLVVWHDVGGGKGVQRAGIRSRDGGWHERELALGGGVIRAASDGREFLLAAGNTFLHLDADGVPSAAGPVKYGYVSANAIAWDGRNYCILGGTDNGLATELRSPAGAYLGLHAVVDPTTRGYDCSSLATNGDGFFAACSIPSTGGVAGLRFDAGGRFERKIILTANRASAPRVIWNGLRYVAAWSEEGRLVVAHIRRAGVRKETLGDAAGAVSLAPGDGGAWLGWIDSARRHNVAYLADEGDLTGPSTIAENASALPILQRLADGTLLSVTSEPRGDAPSYGQGHVLMQVGTAALPAPAAAPALRVRQENGNALLEWSAPPQRVNGYRLEYAVDDGAWVELEAWLDAGRRSLSFGLPWPEASYSFRLRAFNDAGAGAYSERVTTR